MGGARSRDKEKSGVSSILASSPRNTLVMFLEVAVILGGTMGAGLRKKAC